MTMELIKLNNVTKTYHLGEIDVPVLNKPYRREELARQLRVVLGGEERVAVCDALAAR